MNKQISWLMNSKLYWKGDDKLMGRPLGELDQKTIDLIKRIDRR